MLLTLWKQTLPQSERLVIDGVFAVLKKTGVGVEDSSSTASPSSIIAHLKGEAADSDAFASMGRFFRYLGARPAQLKFALSYITSMLEKEGLNQEAVLSLLNRLAPSVNVTLEPGASLEDSLSSAITQIGNNMQDPIAPVMGALCSCPSCNFAFVI